MEQSDFIKRMVELRINKGVSAREMSLSLGQSAGYINNIENGISYPSLTVFFYICDYFKITPKEFFDTENTNPSKLQELCNTSKKLSNDNLDILISIAKGLIK